MISRYSKHNSVHEIVDTLKKLGPMTETEVFKATFGYDRNNSMESNKKYADMLRRGMKKGIIDRVECEGLGRAKFVYYAPREVKVTCSAELDNSWYNESI
jgi:wyosine [tRNA(Phe)-imidazoG37] synthetase (radical SAM superfamily)|tara:strand:- start:89 stop:388 length:300 start_codon:yes stop_codon:yes gene_type:complete